MSDPRDVLPEGYTGPWIATMRDGPAAGDDRIFAVGPIWSEIRLVHLSRDFPGHRSTTQWADHWAIVGGGGIDEGEEPWPGSELYQLAKVVTMAGADGEPIALYDWKGSADG